MPITPGDWGFAPESGPRQITLKRDFFSIGSLENNRGIAIVFSDDMESVEPDNARLMAAAKKLLVACEAVMGALDSRDPEVWQAIQVQVDEAIAAAKGGAPSGGSSSGA